MDRRHHSEPEFRVLVGDRWRTEARRLQASDARHLVGDYDIGVLRAHIDVVVGGSNVTADLPDEPLLGFFDAWVTAVERLGAGAARAHVELGEAPFVFAFESHGDEVLVSLFELGAPGWFRIEREPVPCPVLLAGLAQVLDGLVEEAAHDRLRPHRALVDLRARVPARIATRPSTASPSPVAIETRTESGATVTTRIDPASSGIFQVTRPAGFDRHALLAEGDVTLRYDGAPLRLVGRPLRLLEDLVEALASSEQRGDRRPAVQRLSMTENGPLDLRSTAAGDARLAVRDAVVELPSSQLARLVAEHVEVLVGTLTRLNPALEDHPILRDMLAQSVAIRDGLARSGLARPVPGSRRRVPPGRAALPERSSSTYGFPPDSIRRMRYERAWSVGLAGLEPRTVRFVHGDGCFVAHSGGASVLDGGDGSERFALPAAGQTGSVRWTHAGGVVVRVASGGMKAWTIAEGAPVWERPGESAVVCTAASERAVVLGGADATITALATRDGAALWRSRRLAAPADGIALGDGLVVASSAGRLVALDAGTGRELWSLPVPYQRVSFRLVGGDCVVAADDPLAEASRVGIVDGSRGEWVRRLDVAADVRAVGWSRGRGVAVLVGAGAELRVLTVDLREGVEWTAPICVALDERGFAPGQTAGGAMPRPACMLDEQGVVVGFGGTIQRVRADGAAWALAGSAGPLRLLSRASTGGFVFAADDGGLRVFESASGRELERVPAFWERLWGAAAGEAAHLAVVEEAPGCGWTLHGVRAVGVLAALDGGRASRAG